MIEEIDDISDEKWAKLIASKRHNEISILLKKIISSLSAIKDGENSDAIVEAIIKNNETISTLFKKAIPVAKFEMPKNNNELSLLIKDFNANAATIKEGQDKIIELLNNKPKTMIINRSFGIIDSIDIKYGSINN